MLQKFYTDTLGGRFIKSLLAQTPVPVFDCVQDGDDILAGCYYIYKTFLIHCETSGKLVLSKGEQIYPSDTLFPSNYLHVNGYTVARFKVVKFVSDLDPNSTTVFKSSCNYYDPKTHFYLGKYLRYLYTTTGLNLMRFYNCYNSTYLNDVELHVNTDSTVVSVSSVLRKNQKYKVVAIPIMFGKTYTIAIDSSSEALFRACFYSNNRLMDESLLSQDLQNSLKNSSVCYPYLKFDNPERFRIETSERSGIMLQNNLYLLIQLPKDNTSSIVVLENYEHSYGISTNKEGVRNVPFNSSLLQGNTNSSYAFSDRLVEYILGNVIHSFDESATNIEKIQTALSKSFDSYSKSFISGKNKKGVWDDDIPRLVTSLLESSLSYVTRLDQDGNVNKDVETILYYKGGLY